MFIIQYGKYFYHEEAYLSVPHAHMRQSFKTFYLVEIMVNIININVLAAVVEV
jgi:hypothetical protein